LNGAIVSGPGNSWVASGIYIAVTPIVDLLAPIVGLNRRRIESQILHWKASERS
jgi:hypothetical protein